MATMEERVKEVMGTGICHNEMAVHLGFQMAEIREMMKAMEDLIPPNVTMDEGTSPIIDNLTEDTQYQW